MIIDEKDYYDDRENENGAEVKHNANEIVQENSNDKQVGSVSIRNSLYMLYKISFLIFYCC